MNFQEKLIGLRKQKGLSQEQLAEQLGVSRQAVSRWELGESTPDVNNLLGICKYFEVSSDYLIHDDYKAEQKPTRQPKEADAVTCNHAGQWIYIARRVIAHVRAYLDAGQYDECRDSEQACLANLSVWRTERKL